MARPQGLFHMETAGSLTPELEGSSRSGRHSRSGVDKLAKKAADRPTKDAPKHPAAEDKPHDA